MRIALIDDERPSRSELRHLVSECVPEAEIDEADSGQKAIELASENTYDVMFIDIHLGDMTGTTLSLMLKKLLPGVQIVFATAYDEYAVKAFDMDATDYIMKPFDPKRVGRCLKKVQERLCAAEAALSAHPSVSVGSAAHAASVPQEESLPIAGKLSITCEKRVVMLDIREIAYIETDSRCCVLHTVSANYTSTQPLGYFEKKLAQEQFFRIHKSYLVNLQYVTELYPWFNGMSCVKLRGFEKENLPVSRKQVKLLREIFEI